MARLSDRLMRAPHLAGKGLMDDGAVVGDGCDNGHADCFELVDGFQVLSGKPNVGRERPLHPREQRSLAGEPGRALRYAHPLQRPDEWCVRRGE